MINLNPSIKILFPLFISIFLAGCGPSFQPIENTSNKIVKGCLSVSPPPNGNWYVDEQFLSGIYGPDCESQIGLLSGGGEDFYHIYISGKFIDWKVVTNNEELLNQISNLDFETMIGSKNVNLIQRKTEICKNTNEMCVMAYFEYTSDKRIIDFKTRDAVLNPADKYYYQTVYYYLIKGPYIPKLASSGYGFRIIYAYTHESTNNHPDPELENKASTVLTSIEFTKAGKFKSDDGESEQ